MITSALIALALVFYGDEIAATARKIHDSRWFELAAFIAVGITISLVTGVIGALL